MNKEICDSCRFQSVSGKETYCCHPDLPRAIILKNWTIINVCKFDEKGVIKQLTGR